MIKISTIDLRILFDVFVVNFAEASIDNDKNIKGLFRIDGVITLIIFICIILSWVLYFFSFFSYSNGVDPVNVVAALLYYTYLKVLLYSIFFYFYFCLCQSKIKNK